MRYPAQGDLAKRRPNFEIRAKLAESMRRFFVSENFLEVTTPSLIPAPAQEEYIETVPAADGFLRPSPELEMKMMLAAGYDRIFQFGPCWRAEEAGRRHRREFTMLEYYAADWNYLELRDFTAAMIERAALDVFGDTAVEYRGARIDLSAAAAQTLTVKEAYRRFASDGVDFDEAMVLKVEPELGRGRTTYLIDYPSDRAALARRKESDPSVAERWELYIAGLELANAFGELTDADEQRRRFAAAAKVRAANGLQAYPEAEWFFEALEKMPESSGAALGFDRLVMVFCNADDIAEVGF